MPGPREPIEAIRLRGVSRAYPSGASRLWALRGVALRVPAGGVVAVVGPSGSGKSTLLNLIAGIDRPSEGEITVLGRRIDGLSERELTAFRAESVGLVFQDPHLLPGLTALENVVVARLPWQPRRELESRARELLAAVGLGERMDHPPGRLSSGERQRVGLARALIGRQPLLLADEPTGNLDTATTESLLALLEQLHGELGLTIVIATHDAVVAAVAGRVVRLAGGQVQADRAIAGEGALSLHTLE